MKFSLFTAFLLCTLLIQGQQKLDLAELYKHQLFAELNARNTDSGHADYYYYKAIFAYACNDNLSAIQYLDSLESKGVSSEISYDFCALKINSYNSLSQYQKAYNFIDQAVQKYATQLSDKHKASLLSTANKYKALQDIPPLKIQGVDTCRVARTMDKFGLSTILMQANKVSKHFIFDTGTSTSIISESLAKAMGCTFLHNRKLALAKRIQLGDILIENLIFIVYPDYMLSFGKEYKINGIIGLDLAKVLGTFSIEKDQISIYKTSVSKEKNLFLYHKLPVLCLNYKGATLPFFFDTGSAETTLTQCFYDRYKTSIRGRHCRKAYNLIGQRKKYKSLKVKTLKVELNGEKIDLSKKIIIKEPSIPWKNLYGLFGQDILNQHKRVVISFDQGLVELEN